MPKNQKPIVLPQTAELPKILKLAKEARDKRVIDLWLACYTQEEIAGIVNAAQQTMSDWINSFTENPPVKNSVKPASEHLTDFEPPIYNIWRQKKKHQRK